MKVFDVASEIIISERFNEGMAELLFQPMGVSITDQDIVIMGNNEQWSFEKYTTTTTDPTKDPTTIPTLDPTEYRTTNPTIVPTKYPTGIQQVIQLVIRL